MKGISCLILATAALWTCCASGQESASVTDVAPGPVLTLRGGREGPIEVIDARGEVQEVIPKSSLIVTQMSARALEHQAAIREMDQGLREETAKADAEAQEKTQKAAVEAKAQKDAEKAQREQEAAKRADLESKAISVFNPYSGNYERFVPFPEGETQAQP